MLPLVMASPSPTNVAAAGSGPAAASPAAPAEGRLIWNNALDAAIKEIALQAHASRLQGYLREEYAAACRDCVMVVALLREPRITAQQGAELVIKLLVGDI